MLQCVGGQRPAWVRRPSNDNYLAILPSLQCHFPGKPLSLNSASHSTDALTASRPRLAATGKRHPRKWALHITAAHDAYKTVQHRCLPKRIGGNISGACFFAAQEGIHPLVRRKLLLIKPGRSGMYRGQSAPGQLIFSLPSIAAFKRSPYNPARPMINPRRFLFALRNSSQFLFSWFVASGFLLRMEQAIDSWIRSAYFALNSISVLSSSMEAYHPTCR